MSHTVVSLAAMLIVVSSIAVRLPEVDGPHLPAPGSTIRMERRIIEHGDDS